MSHKASPTAIGAFVVGSIVLVVVGLLIFGSGRVFREIEQWVVFFEGSVNGLNAGAPVKFRGVRIGQVRWIRALAVPETGDIQIAVLFETEEGRIQALRASADEDEQDAWARLIEAESGDDSEEVVEFLIQERGMRAQLEVESFVTGQLFVNLDFYPGTEIRRLGLVQEFPEIPAVPSDMQQIRLALSDAMKEVRQLPLKEVVENVLETVEAANQLLNSPEVGNAVKEVDLALGDARKLIAQISAQVDPVSADLRTALTRADGALAQAESTLAQGSDTLRSLDGAVGEDSDVRFALVETLRDLAAASRSIRKLAESLERSPNALIFGRVPPGEE